jgi:hypothetical protein
LHSLFTAVSDNTDGTFKPTRAAYTWNRVEHWLNGATFSGTPPTGTRSNGNAECYGELARCSGCSPWHGADSARAYLFIRSLRPRTLRLASQTRDRTNAYEDSCAF